MQITDLKFSVLKPKKTYTFGVTTYPVQYGLCKVFTDGGIKGAYITTGWIDPHLLANQFEAIKGDIIGHDPFDREKIEKQLERKWRMRNALAVLDICLWDIASKALNLPVYKLLLLRNAGPRRGFRSFHARRGPHRSRGIHPRSTKARLGV